MVEGIQDSQQVGPISCGLWHVKLDTNPKVGSEDAIKGGKAGIKPQKTRPSLWKFS